MNNYSREKLIKVLVVLGILVVFGTPQAHAFWPLVLVTGVVGWNLFGGALEGLAADIVQGIATLIGGIINMLGGIFYFIANRLMDFAVGVNDLISTSEVVKTGYDTTLLVVNLGLVLGLVILAFAIMTRASWLVEARQAIPKFITAVLLINFGFFITTELLINPSNEIAKTIYEASQYDDESFRGAFQPDLDLKTAMRVRIMIAKSDDTEREKLEKYFLLQEEINGAVVYVLDNLDLQLFSISGLTVSETQKQVVVIGITETINEWLNDPIDHGFEFNWNLGELIGGALGWAWDTTFEVARLAVHVVTDWNDIPGDARDAISRFFSPLEGITNKLSDALEQDWVVDKLQKNITVDLGTVAGAPYAEGLSAEALNAAAGILVNGVRDAMNASFGCDMYTHNDESSPECQEILDAADLVQEGAKLTDWEETTVVFAEVLFESLFVFLGSFSLLGFAVMYMIRYVALSFLIILFPFAWIGWVFPKLTAAGGGKNLWTSWWSQFIKWLIFGPLGMFFFFLAVQGALTIQQLTVPSGQTLQDLHGVGTAAVLGAAVGDLAVVLGLLMGGLYTANKLSIVGAKTFYGGALKMKNWVGKQVKKQAIRGTKAGLRKAGHAATAPLRSEAGQKRLAALHNVPILKYASRAADKLAYRSEKATDAAAKKGLPMDDDTRLARMAQGLRGVKQAAAIEALTKKGKADKIIGWDKILADPETRSTFLRLNKKGVLGDFGKQLGHDRESLLASKLYADKHKEGYDAAYDRATAAGMFTPSEEGAKREYAMRAADHDAATYKSAAEAELKRFWGTFKNEDWGKLSPTLMGAEHKEDVTTLSKDEHDRMSSLAIEYASKHEPIGLERTRPKLSAKEIEKREPAVEKTMQNMVDEFMSTHISDLEKALKDAGIPGHDKKAVQINALLSPSGKVATALEGLPEAIKEQAVSIHNLHKYVKKGLADIYATPGGTSTAPPPAGGAGGGP